MSYPRKPYLVIVETCDLDVLAHETEAEAMETYRQWEDIAKESKGPLVVTYARALDETRVLSEVERKRLVDEFMAGVVVKYPGAKR